MAAQPEEVTAETAAPEETAALGAALARLLQPGDLVELRGELGAGKTTLVRGAARELGVEGPITSPTFTVAQRHEGPVPVAHLDGYRLGREIEPEELDLLRGEADESAVSFLEWPEALAGLLPEARVAISIEHMGGDRRLVRFAAREPADRARLAQLIAHSRPRHRNGEPESGPHGGG